MKKYTVAIVVLTAIVLHAVSSGNVVGYMNNQISKGKNQIVTPFGNKNLTQRISTLLHSACEGDIIEFGGFRAEARRVNGILCWMKDGVVVNDTILPNSDIKIDYYRSEDRTTELSFTGEVERTGPLIEKPSEKIEQKTTPKKPFYLADFISYSTIRLVGKTKEGEIVTGTGFFYYFSIGKGRYIPVIMTNKHVVQNTVSQQMIFTRSINDMPSDEKIFYETKPNRDRWYSHNDKNVDLSYLPIAPIMSDIEKQGKAIFIANYDASMIPSANDLEDITQLDDVAMIGYPNGIWDMANNQPIFRKGSLATRPNKNYNNERVFLIDMPVFGGSSGSPILIASDKLYFDRRTKGYRNMNTLKLLGVVYAVMLHSVKGEIQIVSINEMVANNTNHVPWVRVPNNIGLVISADRILEIEKELKVVFAEK